MDVPLKLVTAREFSAPDDLGTEDSLDDLGFDVRVGDAPVAFRIANGGIDPKDEALQRWHRRFRLWLVPNRLRIIRRKGRAEVKSIGIELEFLGDPRESCTVVSVFPAPQYVESARADLNVTARASVEGNGEIVPLTVGAADGGALSAQLTHAGASIKVGGGFKFAFATTLCTPLIASGGVGSRGCEFRFDQAEQPLHGRDIECWSTVALSRHKTELEYRLRYYLVTRQIFIPSRYESDWQTVKCALK